MKKIKYLLLLLLFCSCIEKNNTVETKYFENNYWSEIKTPIIKINIEGENRYFLIDTGANMSVLDKYFYLLNKDKLNIVNEVEINYSGINGTKTEKSYIISSTFDDKIITFSTSDISSTINTINNKCGIKITGIIGSDFMTNYNAIIDYENRIIKF